MEHPFVYLLCDLFVFLVIHYVFVIRSISAVLLNGIAFADCSVPRLASLNSGSLHPIWDLFGREKEPERPGSNRNKAGGGELGRNHPRTQGGSSALLNLYL